MPPMTGSRYFAEAMQAYEVTHVFLVPTILTPALAEMEDRNIVRVTAHSEKAAVYMADGYARISGRPGVCMAQTIGAANLAAGLRDPYLACTPVIAVTGGRLPESKHRGVYQEVDDFPLFEPLSKFNVQVDLPERLPDLLRQAFREATTGCPAPVHLEIGGNFGQAIEGEADLDPLFEPRFARYPAIRPRPEAGSLRRAAELLSRSRRPVIVAGGGVTLSGAQAEVRQLAERLSIPVATSLNAKGTLPENHSLSIGVVGSYSRDCANRLVAEADLVFFIGSRTGGQVTNSWRIPPKGTPVLQLDIEPAELGRNYPNLCSLWGDAKTGLQELNAALVSRPPDSGWLSRVERVVANGGRRWIPCGRRRRCPCARSASARKFRRPCPGTQSWSRIPATRGSGRGPISSCTTPVRPTSGLPDPWGGDCRRPSGPSVPRPGGRWSVLPATGVSTTTCRSWRRPSATASIP